MVTNFKGFWLLDTDWSLIEERFYSFLTLHDSDTIRGKIQSFIGYNM